MIKRLLLLSLTLILSWNSFSQTVTPIRDTSKITISTTTARRIVVDLLEGDKAKEEVQVLQRVVDNQKEIIALGDSLVNLRGDEIATLNKLLDLKDVEYQENLRKSEQLSRDLRRQTFKANTFMCTTGLLGLTLILSLLIN